MQQTENETLKLQLIETTSVFNKQINNNCSFDGSNLIYLAGSHIVFHNVFQNNKVFIQRLSDSEVLAMAFHKSADISILLVTKDPLCHLEFYFYGKKSNVIDLNQEFEVLDAILLQKKKACLLVYDKKNESPALLLVSHRKIKRVDLREKGLKIVCSEQKILIIVQYGCLEFNIDNQTIGKLKLFENHRVKDIIMIDHDSQLLFDEKGQGHYYFQGKLACSVNLREDFKKSKAEYQTSTKVGKHILVSVKGEFSLGHYQLSQKKIEYLGKFQYNQKVKGSIISLQCGMDEMNLAIALHTSYKDQYRIEHFLFNLSVLSSERKFINPFARLVQGGGQSGQVSGLQTLIPSQIYCLAGPHIINYSFVQHIQKKHKYSIHQSPRSVAVHPLGHQLICTFEAAVKFYQKVEMELVQTWTQPYICYCARYTQSGLLILCVYDEGFYNIVLYNPNNYKKLRTYSSMYLKHAVTRIELDQNQIEMVLYSQKDLLIHRFKTGQKLSEFRQKKELIEANTIQYDLYRKHVLVATKKNLIVCKKTEEYCLNFSIQKTVVIDEEITCIHISESMQTIFMGTADGKILFCPYPFKFHEEVINDQKVNKIKFESVKIHYQTITSLLLTSNCKFLFAAMKGDGLSIAKIKRTGGVIKGSYNMFDISNYNFIETSSKPYLQTVHEKLKGLLEKRKTIFNELDEFKKQWEAKRITETKCLTSEHKRQQLVGINASLAEISRVKLQHQSLMQQLATFQVHSQQTKNENQKNHYAQLNVCYVSNDKLKNKLKEVNQRCQQQFANIKAQCEQNLLQIKSQLQCKFKSFQQNYTLMKQNLFNYKKRIDIQSQQEQAVREEEAVKTKARLKQQQEELYRKNNQLKGQITKNKKQLERFINRKDFLQNKRRFFIEQLKYCNLEQNQLLDVKKQLEKQLVELENVTHKKEKRLRKYFIENEILIKYQLIHDNLVKQSSREIAFIELEHQHIRQKIGCLQKEILSVSEEKEGHQKELQLKLRDLNLLKVENRKLKQKHEFLELEIREMQLCIASANNNKIIDEDLKNQEYISIYQRYFVDKKLQAFLSNREAQENDLIRSENKKNEEGVKTILLNHKDYLVNNMQLFEKYNARVIDEINLTYLKYQTENYNLISECNVRKEQINKNKRVLHELVDQIRQTTNYIAELNSKPALKNHVNSQSVKQIPFVLYEKMQQQERKDTKKESSQSAAWKIKKSTYQVRKMLEIQKLKPVGAVGVSKNASIRRIQTANNKKPLQQSRHEGFTDQSLDVMNPVNSEQFKKPHTAMQRYRRNANQEAKRLFSRNKSSSKPTTCTSHTKSKYSMFA